ncbi:MAG: proline dehydrogenase family protein [Sphingomonadaceae bacterium]
MGRSGKDLLGMDSLWRPALLYISRSKALRRLTTRSGVSRRMALRFVAGERMHDAIDVTREINRRGAGAEIDFLGENVATTVQAEAAAKVYLELLEQLSAAGVEAHVSLKLTQMGLDLDPASCRRNVERVVESAEERANFVWLDMENSDYTDRTLAIYRDLRARHSNVGVAVQAYLYRSKADVQDLVARGGTVRLCKGAYLEPPDVAFANKSDVDRNFMVLSKILLCSRRLQAIATHDEKMIRRVVRFARANGIDRDRYEFQMLYGVRRDLQERLVAEGYRLRVYVPFGREWFPYLMRRLAERPANIVFLISSIARESRSRVA